jgi:DNA-binding SARP family transcriptional activator
MAALGYEEDDGSGPSHSRTGPRLQVADPAQRPLQVLCFGGLRVTAGERELSARGPDGYNEKKSWELLAFLAACRPEVISRERVQTALWPTTAESRSQGSLTTAASRLRALISLQLPELKSELISRDHDGGSRLDTAAVWSDVHQFLQLCQQGRRASAAAAREACEQARELYTGDLLAGTPYKWIDERFGGSGPLREEYREEYRTITKRLGGLYCDEGRPDLAIAIYRALLDQEPTLEDIVRRLYRCYQALGDRAAIKREDLELRKNLRLAYADPDDPQAEVDSDLCEPSAETLAVYAEVLAELDTAARMATAG